MKTKQSVLIIIALFLALFLTACGGSDPAPAPTNDVSEPAPPASSVGTELTGARTLVVDNAGSKASYIVNEEFFADALDKLGINAGQTVVIGTTEGVNGEIQLDFDSEEIVQGAEFTVDMTGLKTDQNRRDEWLIDNAIETGAFPEATFVANSVTGLSGTLVDGEEVNFQMTGDLTVRDVTNEVTWDVTAVINDGTLQGTATLALKITDFGITPPDFANTLKVNDDFTIEVELTAQES